MGSSGKVKHYFRNPVSGGLDIISGQYDAEKDAKKATALQRASILRQQQQEKLKLAESEDEIKRRKYLAKVGGRRSLIASGGVTKGSTDQLGG